MRRFRGEAPIMMMVVLLVRIAFCWIEVAIRAHQRHHGASNTANDRDAIDNSTRSITEASTVGAKSRRSSMTVLYTRIVHSDDAPLQMQYVAVGFFALQPIIFVFYAANTGRGI